MYILDTNAVPTLMRGDAPMLDRFAQVNRSDVAVPQPEFAEIAYGIQRLPRSKHRMTLERRMAIIRSELVVAEWTGAVSDAFGTIKTSLKRVGRRIEDFDAAIGARGRDNGDARDGECNANDPRSGPAR